MSVGWLVGLLVGWSVSHNFCHNFQLKGREVAKGQIKVSSKGRFFHSSFRYPLFIRLLSFAIQSSFTCLGFQLQLTRAQIIYYIFFSDIIASANHKNQQQKRSEELELLESKKFPTDTDGRSDRKLSFHPLAKGALRRARREY